MTHNRMSLAALEAGDSFVDRHIGPRTADLSTVLSAVGVDSLDELARRVLPATLRDHAPALDLPPPVSEARALAELRDLAARNRPMTQLIGLGYYGTVTPPVIVRNVLESPAWYTAYTPYQPEISQGRLEALLNFQTMVADLTGVPVANASMLDEATAAAEAMTLVRRAGRASSPRFLVDVDTFPQTIAVIETRAAPLGIEVVVADLAEGLPVGDCFGVLTSYPAAGGAVRDHEAVIAQAHERGATASARVGRHHAAVRRADGFRRTARRISRGARGAGAATAGAHRRGEHGRGRGAGVPARPADQGTAHP